MMSALSNSAFPRPDQREAQGPPARGEDGQVVGAGGDDDQEQVAADAAAESALPHFSSPRDAATIAAFLGTRVYRPDSLVWLRGCQALTRWRAENGITGPYSVRTTPRPKVPRLAPAELGRRPSRPVPAQGVRSHDQPQPGRSSPAHGITTGSRSRHPKFRGAHLPGVK
ncbi:hypothetical protein OV450_8217 [Actinobacteria bacterium OV450]|nr:hypothetical protein OV450_8217 [Actinobacteria bacterium OV450]